MLKVSRESAEHVESHGPVEDRHQDGDGYTINFLSFGTDVDATPLLKGMPGDQCQCPHWGYVIAGRVSFRFEDREESFEAGDAFFTPPGHVPVKHEPGSEVVMFSPAEELHKTESVMMRNMQALQGAHA